MRRAGGIAVGIVAALLASACTNSGPGGATSRTDALRGGTLRVGVLNDIGLNACQLTLCGGAWDPQTGISEDVYSFEIERCCLLRTLYSYNGQTSRSGGTIPRPDLAVTQPQVSNDGLTWTFPLKRGLRYGPPLQHVEITAQDFIRSIARILSPPPPNAPSYFGGMMDSYAGDYLELDRLIVGADRFRAGKATTISGLEAPDDHTLVVHLTRPAGDLPYRLSLPSTAPLPPNPADPSAPLGVAQGHARRYGSYLVSSGPYMIAGSQEMDFSRPPTDQLPAAGNAPSTLTLVRNPSWRRESDSLRRAYADRIVLVRLRDDKDARQAIAAQRVDVVWDWNAPVPTVMRYQTDSKLRTRLFQVPKDFIRFIRPNLAIPPFDDVHVRKAMNYAIDRQSIARVFESGGTPALPASHIALDAYENNLLLGYDPYGRGGLVAAKQEMTRSRYDGDQDGVCDAAACRNITMLAREDPPVLSKVAAALKVQLAPLGIHIHPVVNDDRLFATYANPGAHVAMVLDTWVKDLPTASLFLPSLFDSSKIGECCNDSLVGASAAQLKHFGYKATAVPSVDDRIAQCLDLLFSDQPECWASLDQYLTERVVPWVPVLVEETSRVVSPLVTRFSFDQADQTPMPALDQIAVRATTAPRPPLVSAPRAPDIPAGIYRFAQTPADLKRFGLHFPPGDVAESTGSITVTLRAGQFEYDTQADHTTYNPVQVGIYSGAGKKVKFTWEAPPDAAVPGPPLSWRFDGNALHFKVLSCASVRKIDPVLCGVMRSIFEAHPWVKVG